MTATGIIPLLTNVCAYALLAMCYFGAGWICSRLMGININHENKYFSLIWTGWAITLLISQVWHLLFPINIYLSISILLPGFIATAGYWIPNFRSTHTSAAPRLYWALLILAALWIANQSMLPPTDYDSGLYHFNTVRWLNEHPIVLGLGNLHGRLAFNQSLLVYVASLNFYPVFNHGYNLANSFLWLLLFAECLWYAIRVFGAKNPTTGFSTIEILIVLLIPVLIFLSVYSSVSSPAPDLASSILQILIFIYFMRSLSMDEQAFATQGVSFVTFLLVITAAAITVKLSNLFYVLSVCAVLFFVHRGSLRRLLKETPIFVVKVIALPVLILTVWGFRGVLLSGCPAYPSTVGCIQTAWSAPIEAVKTEADWVYSWARAPHEQPEIVFGSWDWFIPWLFRTILSNSVRVVYPLFLFLAIELVGLRSYYAHRSIGLAANRNWVLVPVPVLVGLIFWFLVAPDLRFAHALFWILPISATALFIRILDGTGKLRRPVVLLLFFILNASIAQIFVQDPQIRIAPDGYMPIPVRVANLTEKTTVSGLKILVPIKGDQCWDSRIPCTPYFNAQLRFSDTPFFPRFTIR